MSDQRIHRRAFLGAACAAALPAVARAAAPAPIGDRTCLFLDDRFAAETKGLARTWHQGTPLPPAITGDRPWEHWPHLFGSVFYDPRDRLFRMYYEALNPRGKPPHGVLYAESKDGKSWTRPELGLVEVNGSKANNVLLASHELPNAFPDPNDRDPRGRLKMFAWGDGGHSLYRSGDGLRWEKVGLFHISPDLRAPAERGALSDTNVVGWDDLGRRYLCTYRTYPKHGLGFRDGMRRAVGVTTSDKLTSGWKEIVTVLRADDAADAAVARLGTDAKPDWAEPYVMPAFPYGNHYLGLVSLLYYVDGSDSKTGGDLQLAFSHDALKWHRPSPRRSVVAKSGDLFPCYGQCNAPLDLGDELLIYYSEADCAHPSARPRSQIRAASFRKDGFVSLGTKGDEPGALTTPPLTFTGKRLIVNAATEPGGRVRVALLDGDGNAIKGYAEEDCDVVSGTACLVGWNDERNLERFAGKPVRLRFSVRRGRLYSFRFAG